MSGRNARKTVQTWLALIIFFFMVDFFAGITNLLQEIPFEQFSYPPEVEDINDFINVKLGKKEDFSQKYRDIPTLTETGFEKLINPKTVCPSKDPFLLLAVKSKVSGRSHRDLIRNNWGRKDLDYYGKSIVVLFFVGVPKGGSGLPSILREESDKYKDLAVFDFRDAYWNNTYKTAMTYRWVAEYCPQADFTLFADDDYYINTPAIVSHLITMQHANKGASLYEGYVFDGVKPMRHRLRKWTITLAEYPFARFPKFCTGGACLLSREIVRKIAALMPYARFLKIDDAWVGILAYKLGLSIKNTGHFYLDPPSGEYRTDDYSFIWSIHMPKTFTEMMPMIWGDQLLRSVRNGNVKRRAGM